PTQWLFPVFLYGLAAAAVPLLLHLLRLRAGRPQPLPTLRFLALAARPTRHHWIRRWLVLLLRATVFALLAAAFARPYLEAYFTGRRATVVIVDNSFSMQATGRWETLRAWARGQLQGSGHDEAFGLLVMNPTPAWIVPLTGDGGAVGRALDTIQPGWDITRPEPALRLAADVLAANPAQERRIILVGDHQRAGWIGADFKQKLPAGVQVVFAGIPAAAARQAWLHSPLVIRTPSGALAAEVAIAAMPGPGQSRTLRVFAEASGQPDGETTVELAGGEERRVRVELPAAAKARWVRFALDADDLPADDSVYALVPPAVETLGKILLDRAPASDGFDHVAAAFGAFSGLPPKLDHSTVPEGEWPAPAVAVLRNAATFAGESAARLDAFLAGGGQLLVLIDRSIAASDWWSRHGIALTPAGTKTEPPRLREWAPEHALVAPLARHGLRGLVDWRFRQAWALPRAATEPIAFWNDDSVAIGEARVANGRMLLCGFSADRRDGDWPVEGAFVPFLHRSIRYLMESGAREAPMPEFSVGEPIALPGGSGSWRALAGPARDEPPRQVEHAVTPAAPGIYTLEREAGAALWAVNLAREESDLTPWSDGSPWEDLVSAAPAPDDASQRRLLAGVEAEQKTGLWGWCLALAATVMLLELALANRTSR
ncbi:VWA domain-containing protein, partial [Zavarzinia sp.]|uniref:VWA domain-containing protein n=1 Tax=Zavarzinia sp. TaxID=2027920 RepID=UPI003569884D